MQTSTLSSIQIQYFGQTAWVGTGRTQLACTRRCSSQAEDTVSTSFRYCTCCALSCDEGLILKPAIAMQDHLISHEGSRFSLADVQQPAIIVLHNPQKRPCLSRPQSST